MNEAVPELPPDLPVPVNDGACDDLVGKEMPRIRLASTRHRQVDVAKASQQSTVFFFYPGTGKPGAPVPHGWDPIPGARGCTQQNCGYRDLYREFLALGIEVYGISADPLANQEEFANYRHIPYELLNDSGFELTDALHLPTFEFQGQRYIKRLVLVARDGRIEKVFYPVFPPGRNAEVVLEYLRNQ